MKVISNETRIIGKSEWGTECDSWVFSTNVKLMRHVQLIQAQAEPQLVDARKKEAAVRHNYDMLKQSLQDESKALSEDLDVARKGISESSELKSKAEGDLDVTSKELNAKQQVHRKREVVAETQAVEGKSRDKELRKTCCSEEG